MATSNTMEETEDRQFFITSSKQIIDEYIKQNNYKSAMVLLLFVLYRLNDREKKDFIFYYHNFMNQSEATKHILY